ncbi:MAG: hypothetical protein HYY68_06025 [Thaumarchaeota archaeon]|nr:hypothetical protein [Nitrososphaerota archaeon]
MDDTQDSEWITLYKNGWSTTGIGKKYGVSPSTVCRHLHTHIPLRGRIEATILASTKYVKTPFSGDSLESAYLAGFVEDCGVRRRGRLIEVSTTTTHPAMEVLFRGVFQRYGHVTRLAGFDDLHFYYRYSLTTYLDQSFEPVLGKDGGLPVRIPREPDAPMLNTYLGGLVDAEGTVRLYNNHGRADAVLFITINKYQLLNTLKRTLGGNLYGHERAWRLVFYGKNALHILESMNLKHREKISKRDVVQRMTGKLWSEAENEWLEIVDNIRKEVAEYKDSAKSDYVYIHGRRHPKDTRKVE